MFGKISCDRSSIAVKLGDNTAVNENNMMQYLGIIEQKTNDLLQMHAFVQLKEIESKPEVNAGTQPVAPTALLGGPAIPPNLAPIQITPPSTEEDHDDDGDSAEESVDFDRPLTQHELKQRVIKHVTKRELAGQTFQSGATAKRVEKPLPPTDKSAKVDAFQKKKFSK